MSGISNKEIAFFAGMGFASISTGLIAGSLAPGLGWTFLSLFLLVAFLAACGGTVTSPKQKPVSRVAQFRAIDCRTIGCAVRRQTLIVLGRRGLFPTVDAACSSPQPSVCRILVAGTACFAEQAIWNGGFELDEWDTTAVSPAVCHAVLNRVVGS